MLHSVAVHDDDIATAGTDIAATDFIDGEDKVILRDIGGLAGLAPVLFDIQYGIYDAFAAAGLLGARWKIQPNPWPETDTLGGVIDFFSGSKTADVGVTPVADGFFEYPVRNQYGRQLTNNLDWINPGNSVLYSSVAAQDVMLLLHMSYGPRSLPRGGKILHIYKTFAAIVAGNVDLWDPAFGEVLSDDSPGTDPDRRYRVAGMAVQGGTTVGTDYAMAARIRPKGSTTALACLGSGNVEGMIISTYPDDSIEFNGNAYVDVDTVGSAVNDAGAIHLWLEDIGPAVTGGSQGGTGRRVDGAAMPGAVGTGGGGQTSFFGRGSGSGISVTPQGQAFRI